MINKQDWIGFGILAVLDIFLFWITQFSFHDWLFTCMFAGFPTVVGYVGAFAFIMAREGRKEIRQQQNKDREPKKLL